MTHRGAFRCNRLQFGVSVAPGLLQSAMEQLLQGIPGVVPYFDNVLVSAANKEQLFNHLRIVLNRFRQKGLLVKKEKCQIAVPTVEFLRYLVDSSRIHPTNSKIKAIQDAPTPHNQTELQSAPPPRQLYFCPICLRTFLYQSDLERHSITHSESKPYVCRECGKAFKRSSHLQRHKHIHTGERPFSCLICRKGFRESGELLRHQRVHTGEKPYQCQICRLRFTERNTLRRHAKRKHARETYYQRSVEEGGGSWTMEGDWESEVVVGSGDWTTEELGSGWSSEPVENWVEGGNHWREASERQVGSLPGAMTQILQMEHIKDKDKPEIQLP
ncbi:PREDICTED: zinc finger protein 524-like [Thamnophis sirtalis]|uniref:ribonuclease H n=1 Tax=Thamnophis sirtalis TaxID=35019 RepID=A0A6I9XE81_9SAUR|nr:PREDICTED: zinc finger protein 524-like [Thamnophis sirtalis]